MQGARGGGNASHLAQAKQRLNRSSRDVVPRHLQHTNKCVQHTFATHLTFAFAFAFIGPSRLPLNCFFRSRIRDVFVTILRCISVATFLLLLAARCPPRLWFHLATWSVHSAGVVFVSITFSVHLHPAPPSTGQRKPYPVCDFIFGTKSATDSDCDSDLDSNSDSQSQSDLAAAFVWFLVHFMISARFLYCAFPTHTQTHT